MAILITNQPHKEGQPQTTKGSEYTELEALATGLTKLLSQNKQLSNIASLEKQDKAILYVVTLIRHCMYTIYQLQKGKENASRA